MAITHSFDNFYTNLRAGFTKVLVRLRSRGPYPGPKIQGAQSKICGPKNRKGKIIVSFDETVKQEVSLFPVTNTFISQPKLNIIFPRPVKRNLVLLLIIVYNFDILCTDFKFYFLLISTFRNLHNHCSLYAKLLVFILYVTVKRTSLIIIQRINIKIFNYQYWIN